MLFINDYINIKIIINLILLFLLFFIFTSNHSYKNNNNIKKNEITKRLQLSNEFNNIYSILYDAARFGDLNYNFSKDIKSNTINYQIFKKNWVCACVIGKNENLYAREFVEYYRLIGFDKIYIFDNNEINKGDFEEILKKYINNKFVEIIDIKGFESIQIPVYNYCYKANKNKCDWIAFLDFDEYIFINESKNINTYLYNERFQKCQSILLNWKIYDDNDLEKYDNRTLLERFTRQKGNLCVVKSIVRGELNNLIIFYL